MHRSVYNKYNEERGMLELLRQTCLQALKTNMQLDRLTSSFGSCSGKLWALHSSRVGRKLRLVSSVCVLLQLCCGEVHPDSDFHGLAGCLPGIRRSFPEEVMSDAIGGCSRSNMGPSEFEISSPVDSLRAANCCGRVMVKPEMACKYTLKSKCWPEALPCQRPLATSQHLRH